MGDLPRAIVALEKALQIEPENALFRSNLANAQSERSGIGGDPAQPGSSPVGSSSSTRRAPAAPSTSATAASW